MVAATFCGNMTYPFLAQFCNACPLVLVFPFYSHPLKSSMLFKSLRIWTSQKSVEAAHNRLVPTNNQKKSDRPNIWRSSSKQAGPSQKTECASRPRVLLVLQKANAKNSSARKPMELLAEAIEMTSGLGTQLPTPETHALGSSGGWGEPNPPKTRGVAEGMCWHFRMRYMP